jgi:hypothetical protein
VSEPTTLGRFGHHPDPAIDFCTEVDAIEGLYADCLAKLEVFADADARAARAMGFRVGGDPSAVSAKDRLQELVSARKPTTILDAKDAEITSLRAQLDEARAKSNWKCKAPGYFGDQDCDWPNCGCDPHAERVISGLREHGFMDPDTVKEFEAETRDEARRKAIEECAKVADKHSLENDISTRCDSIWLGRMGAAQNIANAIRALLSESKS